MRLASWTPKREHTLWQDVAAHTLAEVLRAAQADHAVRVMLTGAAPVREWFLADLPDGWEHGRHHLDHDTPTGRYRHTGAGVTVEVRRAAEWFGEGDYSSRDASSAWDALEDLLGKTFRADVHLFRSPGATGLDLWIRANRGEVPEPLDDDTQELIRSTSPQHRIQIMPPTSPTIPGLWVTDGRWMYASLTGGLGSGPAVLLCGQDAQDAFDRDPYRRARYLVKFRAPEWWATSGWPGLLMARAGASAADGWHAPMSGEAWADSAEVHLAASMDWDVSILEGIMFTPGRPLDSWTARLVRARENAAKIPDHSIGALVARAVRAVLLHAVGSWHSSGSSELTLTASPMTRPDGEGWDAPELLETGGALWRRRTVTTSDRQLAMRHPEWSSQVWGRAHARILEGPTSDRGRPGGAIHVPPHELVGIYGDAIMTTRRPAWADLDDGRNGRLRVKGHVCGPVPWPTTALERDNLTRAAGVAGITCEKGCDL